MQGCRRAGAAKGTCQMAAWVIPGFEKQRPCAASCSLAVTLQDGGHLLYEACHCTHMHIK